MQPRRTLAVPLDDVPGELPKTNVSKDFDSASVSEQAVRLLSNLTLASFASNAIWRDFVALTPTFRTFFSAEVVHNKFTALSKEKRIEQIIPAKKPTRYVNSLETSSWYDVDITFITNRGHLKGHCAGIVSLSADGEGQLKVWMIRTWLEAFEGHGSPDVLQPQAERVPHHQAADAGGINEIYDVLIAGGGQNGLCLAGRSEALGLKYMCFEKNAQKGDGWKYRYDSLAWHTVKEYGELPFGRTFTPEDPLMIPTKRIAEAHCQWAEKYDISVNTHSEVVEATYNDSNQLWTVRVATPAGEETYQGKNFVLCTAASTSRPYSPSWAEEEAVAESGFKGAIVHSKDYHNVNPWAGKRGVVVGTANTGHDVAEDMVNVGMHTTMLQRGKTFVLPASFLHHGQSISYNRSKDTETADREAGTYPLSINRQILNRAIHRAIRMHPQLFDGLEKAGFLLERYGDISTNLFVRAGGHYIDVGASSKIVAGEIKMKSGEVDRLVEDGIRFKDGSIVTADVIVLCTGFDRDFRAGARQMIGDIADVMDEYWGVDAEGEIRGVGKPAGHPHLYYHGGDVMMARWYSRFMALRMQAEALGVDLGESGHC